MLQRHVSYHWTTSQYPDPKKIDGPPRGQCFPHAVPSAQSALRAGLIHKNAAPVLRTRKRPNLMDLPIRRDELRSAIDLLGGCKDGVER